MTHDTIYEAIFLGTRSSWVLLGFLAIAGYFLMSEHQAHVVAALPWLLLLACPLLHLFMHRGHGGHGGHEGQHDGSAPGDNRPTPTREER